MGSVVFALAAPVGLTAYLTRDKGPGAPRPAAAALPPTYGDGTSAEAHDLRLTNIQLPTAASTPGTLSVEILDQAGRPVTSMVRTRTELLQLYVVPADLTAFQHLDPRLADGTWSATATLPAPGTYRVIAEFVVDAGDHNDHVILGATATVPGTGQRIARMRPVDDDVAVTIEGADHASASGRIRLHVTDRSGRPVKLRTHLGRTARVIGFHEATGSMVQLPPRGEPKREKTDTVLELDVSPLKYPGPYIFFVQLHVGGDLHTLRVAAQLR